MSKRFAVFDLDGTLVRWQLYHALVDRLAKKGYLGEGVEATLF
jgi:phosphoserine phosphatase